MGTERMSKSLTCRCSPRTRPFSVSACRAAAKGGNTRSAADTGVDETHPVRPCPTPMRASVPEVPPDPPFGSAVANAPALFSAAIGGEATTSGTAGGWKSQARTSTRRSATPGPWWKFPTVTPTLSKCGHRTSATVATEVRTCRRMGVWSGWGETGARKKGILWRPWPRLGVEGAVVPRQAQVCVVLC